MAPDERELDDLLEGIDIEMVEPRSTKKPRRSLNAIDHRCRLCHLAARRDEPRSRASRAHCRARKARGEFCA